MMPITRPPTLSQEEMDKLIQALHHQGAKITMLDPRLTQAQVWLLGAMALALVGLVGWSISKSQVNGEGMAVLQAQSAFIIKQVDRLDNQIDKTKSDRDEQLSRMERHIESIDGRLVTVERKLK